MEKTKKHQKLLSCPFCGRDVQTIRMDGEGNLQPDEYFDKEGAWSGISYGITHPHNEKTDCPISTHEDELVGCSLYDSIEDLVEAWNKRFLQCDG